MRVFPFASFLKLAPVVAGILVVATSGCRQRETRVGVGDREQILHVSNGNEPRSLDPHTAVAIEEDHILQGLFEPLVERDPADLHPIPGVAERWDVSPDGKVYTFHLRRNAKWSNGDPVTAHDFVYSIQRALTPSLGAEFTMYLYPIAGAEEFNLGKLKDFAAVGAKATDDFTLEVTLRSPTPYFLPMLDIATYMPVHRATIEKFGPMGQPRTPWTKPETFVGNGAFTLKEWSPNKVIVLVKNTNYWDAANVKLEEIHIYPTELLDAAERNFRAGQLHVTHGLPFSKIDSYRKDSPELLQLVPYLRTQYIGCNVTNGVLANTKVRRALGLAIDREAIVKTITRGGERAATSYTPPDTYGYTARAKQSYDPDTAKKLLAESGFPNGAGFPELEMVLFTSEANKLVAEAVQQMWKQVLNVNITLANMEKSVFLDLCNNKRYQLYLGGWTADYPDPNGFLEMWQSATPANYTGFSDARFDKSLAAAANELDPGKRYEDLQQAEQVLMDEAPILPIYHHTRVFLMRPSVKGWHKNALDTWAPKFVSLEPVAK
jgi:oligopeptide transport system substrate-binding protein